MSDHDFSFRPKPSQSTVLRYTWLVAAAFIVGAPVAYAVRANLIKSYTVEGSLWIQAAPDSREASAAQADGLPASSAWINLLRSYRVLDAVVVDQKLYLQSPEAHASAFASFGVAEPFVPGAYELRVGSAGEDFVLVTGDGDLVQQGLFGTAIGENVGFEWTVLRGSFEPGATVEFSVHSVRDAAHDLSSNLMTVLDRDGNFLNLRLEGRDPLRAAAVLNTLMERYVDTALELKTSKLDETLAILEEQLLQVTAELEQAERDLEGARLRSATQAIEEGPLRRRVETTENLYREIRDRVDAARLARASAIPDVRILDRASVVQ